MLMFTMHLNPEKYQYEMKNNTFPHKKGQSILLKKKKKRRRRIVNTSEWILSLIWANFEIARQLNTGYVRLKK